jgi:hypothetical protein
MVLIIKKIKQFMAIVTFLKIVLLIAVKLSNFMRSKTDEAVLAPSSLESSVRKQVLRL